MPVFEHSKITILLSVSELSATILPPRVNRRCHGRSHHPSQALLATGPLTPSSSQALLANGPLPLPSSQRMCALQCKMLIHCEML